ncbi:MAG: glycoside hydrolase family 88 protein, partial [Bacteroidales bacterium]|nr:glycoside hydrolase family 88 protein [Bacteroidales bacterium]
DLGFITFCSFGNPAALTEHPEYASTILAAADTMMTLFNPAVGTMLSWPRELENFGGHNTIMDNMINLETLFWASENGGSRSLYDAAVSHADTTMKYCFRPDASSFHVAVYNPEGGHIRSCTHQGEGDETTWARGQAWAVYGFTMCYDKTGESRFLDMACRTADYFISALPEDKVPNWDFDSAVLHKDVSASAIVASALLKLSQLSGKTEYHEEAVAILHSLYDNYRADDSSTAFLEHAVGHWPAGSEIDYSIIYADYYFIEALTRLAAR